MIKKLGQLRNEQKYQQAVELFEQYAASKNKFSPGLFTGAFRIFTTCLLDLVSFQNLSKTQK